MVEKRAEVGYNIPGDDSDNQNGTLIIPSDVAIIASNRGEADIHKIAAMRVNHIGFLRVYFVDDKNNKIIYEPWQNTLSGWLSLKSVQIYKLYNPEGFPADYRIFKISMEVIDYIRYLLYALMHLHKKNYCVDGNFTIDNVVISNGMPKFKGLGVRLINDEKQKEQEVAQVKGDYTNFRKLVNRILTYKDSACPAKCQTPEDSKCPQHSKCPADMRDFLDLLLDPIDNKILIMYHCALWTSKQKMGYLQSFHDGWDYLPWNTKDALEGKFDSITELKDWQRDATSQAGSPLYRVYSEFKDRPKDVRYHFEFLRHYIAHVSRKVKWADYNLNKVEGVLTATYPLSICFLLKKLHEFDKDSLIDYLPKELEKVLR
ncbi:hypothetical protein ACSBR2_016612 [Camellia fascicularis]